MKRFRSSATLLLALILVFSLLAGCGTAATTTATTAATEAAAAATEAAAATPVTAEEVTLHGMHWVSSTAEQAAYEEKFRIFEKENPGIKIKWEWYPTGFAEKLTALYAADQAPDIFMSYTGDLGARVKNGYLAPLDEFFNTDDSNNADLLPNAIVKYDGKVYGILDVITPQVLYYNKDLFDSAGISYPAETWTWEDMKTAASKLTVKEGDKYKIYGFQCDEYNRVWLSYFWSNGGVAFDSEEKPTKPTFNGPEGVAAAQFLYDMTLTLGVAPPPGVVGGLGFREAFTNGMVGMMLDGSWMNSQFAQKEGLKYGVALVPNGSKSRGGWMAPTAIAMSTQTKYKEQSWKFIKFNFSKENSLRSSGYGDALKASGVPVWKSAYTDPLYKPAEQLIMIGKQAEFAKPEMKFENFGVWFWDTMNVGLQSMLANKTDPKKAMDEIAAKTQTDVLDKIGK